MKYLRNAKPFTGQLDVAPFAGVCFLLVLMLLLHTYLVPPSGISIDLPIADLSDSDGAHPSLVVAVDRAEQFYFEHQVIRESDLRARLAAKAHLSREPLTLLVQADGSVRHAAIVRLTALARGAGIRKVVIATRPALFPEGAGSLAKP